jgi:hypothetical protein
MDSKVKNITVSVINHGGVFQMKIKFNGYFRVSMVSSLLLITAVSAGAFDFESIVGQDSAQADSISSIDGLGALNAGDLAEAAKGSPISLPLPKPSAASSKIPVVITVPGLKFAEVGWGPLEPRSFIKLAQVLLSDSKENRGAKTPAASAALESAFAEYNAQFDDLREAEALLAKTPGSTRDAFASDDSYLEDTLSQTPACARLKVVPFLWSRDPGDTEAAVEQFIPKLAQVYDKYKNTGQPIYILAHSWGTVIMHDVLHRLAKDRPDVKIDKFITLGSPLMPGNAIITLFKKVQIYKQDLEKAVRKPANVRYWKNVWSSRDPFSNEISAADENFQDDKDVEPNLEALLRERILDGTGGRMQAKTDLIAIMNVRLWHKSYYSDYSAYLKTLDKHISVTVYDPHVVKPLTARH